MTSIQIMEILSLPQERFRTWLKNGYIKPTYPAKKRGNAAKYTLADFYLIGTFNILVNSGHKRSTAAYLISALQYNNKILTDDTIRIYLTPDKEISIVINAKQIRRTINKLTIKMLRDKGILSEF